MLCMHTRINTQTCCWVQELACLIVVIKAKLLSMAADFPHVMWIILDKDTTEWRSGWWQNPGFRLYLCPADWGDTKKFAHECGRVIYGFMPHHLKAIFTGKTNFMDGWWTWNMFCILCVSWRVLMSWSGVYFYAVNEIDLTPTLPQISFCFCIFF